MHLENLNIQGIQPICRREIAPFLVCIAFDAMFRTPRCLIELRPEAFVAEAVADGHWHE